MKVERIDIDEQLKMDRIIYGASYERIGQDGKRERINPTELKIVSNVSNTMWVCDECGMEFDSRLLCPCKRTK